jgi:hypothetical protein
MALMVLVAVFVDIPRAAAGYYLLVFCACALWLVEEEVQGVRSKPNMMSAIRISG